MEATRECTLCYAGVYEDKLVVFSARRGDRLIVVEDVPALVCGACGDRIRRWQASPRIRRRYTAFPTR